MNRIKLAIVIISVIASLPLFGSCSSIDISQAVTATAAQAGPWSVAVLSYETDETLSGTQNALQYNGKNVSTQIQETPGEGNVFLLVELKIEKVQTGASAFSWNKLYISDSAGNQYQRCANDSFLENYGYERIKSTDLVLGTNEGYICVEIPTATAQETLTLNYQSDGETLCIPLS